MKRDFWGRIFFAPANLVGFFSALIGSVAVPHPAPLLVWVSVESLYLGFSLWREGHPPRRSPPPVPEGWDTLAPSQREQYRVLRALRTRLEENLQSLPGGKAFEAISQPRLDALLDEFVRLLHTLNQHREFLSGAEPYY
jgi:hypothetical protein